MERKISMSLWARSDLAAITVSEAHGGCGHTHSRPAPGGVPVQPWKLDCAGGCEDHLRHDPHWASTSAEIAETYDEGKAREDFEKRGAKDKDAVLALAIARIAGIETSELPESLTRMISGKPLHIPVQALLECPSGHGQPAGAKFCAECGQPMSSAVAKASLPAAEKTAAPAADTPADRKPRRLRDARLDELQALARAWSADESGTRGDLISRLSAAGVTSNDLARLPVAV